MKLEIQKWIIMTFCKKYICNLLNNLRNKETQVNNLLEINQELRNEITYLKLTLKGLIND